MKEELLSKMILVIMLELNMGGKKLCLTFKDKEKYIRHYKNLKQHLYTMWLRCGRCSPLDILACEPPLVYQYTTPLTEQGTKQQLSLTKEQCFEDNMFVL